MDRVRLRRLFRDMYSIEPDPKLEQKLMDYLQGLSASFTESDGYLADVIMRLKIQDDAERAHAAMLQKSEARIMAIFADATGTAQTGTASLEAQYTASGVGFRQRHRSIALNKLRTGAVSLIVAAAVLPFLQRTGYLPDPMPAGETAASETFSRSFRTDEQRYIAAMAVRLADNKKITKDQLTWLSLDDGQAAYERDQANAGTQVLPPWADVTTKK